MSTVRRVLGPEPYFPPDSRCTSLHVVDLFTKARMVWGQFRLVVVKDGSISYVTEQSVVLAQDGHEDEDIELYLEGWIAALHEVMEWVDSADKKVRPAELVSADVLELSWPASVDDYRRAFKIRDRMGSLRPK